MYGIFIFMSISMKIKISDVFHAAWTISWSDPSQSTQERFDVIDEEYYFFFFFFL